MVAFIVLFLDLENIVTINVPNWYKQNKYFQFQLAEVYGNVFSLRVGSEKMVVVSGYKMVKEALITQIDSFVERPNVPLFHKVYKGTGMYTYHNDIND